AKSCILRATENSMGASASAWVSAVRTSVAEATEARGVFELEISLTLWVSETRSMLGDLSALCGVCASDANAWPIRRTTIIRVWLFITTRRRQDRIKSH